MRVVIIGQQLNRNHADRLKGGIQTCERLHVKLLNELGHEIHFIAAADTEPFTPHAKLHLLELPSEETLGELSRADKAKVSRQKTVEIRDTISEIRPDFIINHSYSSSHVRLLADHVEQGIPGIFFNHQNPVVASDISLIAKLEQYIRMTKLGGALVCVSPFSRDLWRRAIRKRLKSASFAFVEEEMIDQVYNMVCPPAYIDQVKVWRSDPSNIFVIISRPTREKNVAGFLEVYERSRLKNPVVIFLAVGGDLESNEYWLAELKPIIERLKEQGVPIKVRSNAPRADVLSALETAAFNVIPWVDESASIVALEGAQYGTIPLMMSKTREDGSLTGHAAQSLIQLNSPYLEMLPAGRKHQERAAARLRDTVQSYEMSSPDEQYKIRNYLRDRTLRKHSLTCRVNDLADIMAEVRFRVSSHATIPAIVRLLEM